MKCVTEHECFDFAAGDKVRFCRGELNKLFPDWYPPAGTVGTVVGVSSMNSICVKWPDGTTSLDDTWIVSPKWVEKVEDGKE